MYYLSDEWLNTDEIILYGLGNIGRKCLPKLLETFKVKLIIDNDKKKQGIYERIPVKGINEVLPSLEGAKIIVMTGGKVYEKIARALIEKGLTENQDFCSVELFISTWYWQKEHKNCLLEVHTTVTTKCTFNCKNCNMFMPYYKEPADFKLDELKQNFDLLFGYIDYVFCINLLGGEPLLYEKLGNLILYLHETYGEKIGTIGIITNGSMLPSDELLDVMKRCGIYVQISDYSLEIPYATRLADLIDVLQQNGISFLKRSSLQWKEFGFPEKKAEFHAENLRSHMLTCAPVFHGLNDGKYYFCHVSWSAEKCGKFQLCETDYVDLKELNADSDADKRKLVEHSLGEMQNGYISFCQFCGGCGDDNFLTVKAAVQVKRDHE